MPGVEEICELRGTIGLMAFHGGNLERTTDAVARSVAERTDASFYAVLQAAPLRKHLPSTAFRPEESSALSSFVSHVREVIAIHGYGRETSWWHLLLGGRNRQLAHHLTGFLRKGLPEPYQVVDDLEAIPRELRGQHKENPVNLPINAGVQIELPPTIRWNRLHGNWSDHQGTPRAPQVEQLIDALVAAVQAWKAQ
ncbi:MAG: poly-gamma-glutamate hydrolase family protein [Myxococcota bacterium]|nr:poly-gamma-glutamate hydrolase family protein [Myxococcota bacterium]